MGGQTIAMRKKDFTSKKSATNFASKVKGTLIDLTKDDKSKANYRVRYEPTGVAHNTEEDFSPETGHDFGYPNEYWQ